MQTKKVFDREGIEYTEVDLTQHPDKLDEFKAQGFTAAPIVTTDIKTWSGFKLPKIMSLAGYIKSMGRGDA
jgi:glutaredoxin-like protein NrdH